MPSDIFEVIVVGGGPAGLNAAVVLGRCRRRVLLCDAGHPRNEASGQMHGYLSRDGMAPAEFLRLGREELNLYGVQCRAGTVVKACATPGGFEVSLESGEVLYGKKLLLTTGVKDKLPEIQNIDRFYGRSVFHCPYCDGWEMRDQPLAVYGRGKPGAGLALSLLTWTSDVVLCTDGPHQLSRQELQRLEEHRISVRDLKIASLEGKGEILERIVFANGESLARRGMFFNTGQWQQCNLAQKFGCVFTSKGAVRTDRFQRTGTPGLYVAGDASHDVQFVIVAAAEGAKAAVAINTELQKEQVITPASRDKSSP